MTTVRVVPTSFAECCGVRIRIRARLAPTVTAAERLVRVMRRAIAITVTALPEPPPGYQRCWLQAWPPSWAKTAPGFGPPMLRVSMAGCACFVRTEFVPPPPARGDLEALGAELRTLEAAILPGRPEQLVQT